MNNKISIILKSGYEINILTDKNVKDIRANISLKPGSCLDIGESFIVCSEIAAVMDAK